ncbi:MAG: hypothetical protein ACFFAS_07630 [Promethearchaeota archaeon]
MIFHLTLDRFITIYIVQSLFLAFYTVIIYRLLHERKKITHKRIVFSFYYFISSIAIVLNYIYAAVYIYPITNLLYLSTIYSLYFGMGIIAIFIVGIYYERKENKRIPKIQVSFISIYGLLLLVIYFIDGAVEINDDTKWKPVVNMTFLIYCSCLLIVSFVILLIYSYKTHNLFVETNQERIIIRNWIMFFIGILLTFIFAEFTMLNHFINNDTVRELWSVIGGVLLILGIILIWFGIGKKFL